MHRHLASALVALTAAVTVAGTSTAAPPSVVAPGYTARYLVGPNPLPASNGLAMDDHGNLYIAHVLFDRVSKLNVDTSELEEIAHEADGDPIQLQLPDDLALGPDGDLYVTTALTKSVVRMTPDGEDRAVVAANISDGRTGPNGIAFRPDEHGDPDRLFVTDLNFDPNARGGLWEVVGGTEPRLPDGTATPGVAVPVVRGLAAPEGFDFDSNGTGYVPELFGRRIVVVDVTAGTAVPLAGQPFSGFPTALKVTPADLDPAEPLILVETDRAQSRIWRVERASGTRTLLAVGRTGVDNVEIDPRNGTIYVSNFITGNINRVNEPARRLDPVLRARPLSVPVSLNPDGDRATVGDVASFASVKLPSGSVTHLSGLIVDEIQLLTPSAVRVRQGTDADATEVVYFTDSLVSKARVMKLDLQSGVRTPVVERGFVLPWHIRQAPGNRLLVTDEVLGTVSSVDPSTSPGTVSVVVSGLNVPGGLAVDPVGGRLYVSESGGGRIVTAPVGGGAPTVFATACAGETLEVPEGVALDGQGGLLVVEAGRRRLLRIDIATRACSVVATRLATTLGGPTGFNYTSDVLALPGGDILVTGDADGSIVALEAE